MRFFPIFYTCLALSIPTIVSIDFSYYHNSYHGLLLEQGPIMYEISGYKTIYLDADVSFWGNVEISSDHTSIIDQLSAKIKDRLKNMALTDHWDLVETIEVDPDLIANRRYHSTIYKRNDDPTDKLELCRISSCVLSVRNLTLRVTNVPSSDTLYFLSEEHSEYSSVQSLHLKTLSDLHWLTLEHLIRCIDDNDIACIADVFPDLKQYINEVTIDKLSMRGTALTLRLSHLKEIILDSINGRLCIVVYLPVIISLNTNTSIRRVYKVSGVDKKAIFQKDLALQGENEMIKLGKNCYMKDITLVCLSTDNISLIDECLTGIVYYNDSSLCYDLQQRKINMIKTQRGYLISGVIVTDIQLSSDILLSYISDEYYVDGVSLYITDADCDLTWLDLYHSSDRIYQIAVTGCGTPESSATIETIFYHFAVSLLVGTILLLSGSIIYVNHSSALAHDTTCTAILQAFTIKIEQNLSRMIDHRLSDHGILPTKASIIEKMKQGDTLTIPATSPLLSPEKASTISYAQPAANVNS